MAVAPTETLPPSHASLSADLERAFDREARIGVLIALAGRGLFIAYGVFEFVLNTIPFRSHMPAGFSYPLALAVFAIGFNLFSVFFFVIALRSKTPVFWCFVSMLLDVFVISELKFFWLWAPAMVAHAPLFIMVRYLDVIVFFLFIAIYTLPMRRALVTWTGVMAVGVWAAGIAYTFRIFPSASLYWGPFGHGLATAALSAMMKPTVLIGDFAILQVLTIALFALFQAIGVEEGHRFVEARVRAEADRAVLARFFPPDVATRISASPGERLTPGRRTAAILFVGIPRGVTGGGDSFAALESFFTTVEQAVFAHEGILDRFDGSPSMASFGALQDDAMAARKAFDCARDLARRFADDGATVSIGAHSGSCVCGEAGGARNRMFSVVGDAVNVSRRILDTAEARGAAIVCSDDVVGLARLSDDERRKLTDLGTVNFRGRDSGLHLWSIAP